MERRGSDSGGRGAHGGRSGQVGGWIRPVEVVMRRQEEGVAAAAAEAAVRVLSVPELRMTSARSGSSGGRRRRRGLPRLGHHVFVVYLNHPEKSRVVPANEINLSLFHDAF